MKVYTKDSLIAELRRIRNMGWISGARHGNVGDVGNTLEDLLGIQENNLPIPNASEWELKCQRVNTTSLVTLFHSEPSPRALKFVPSMLLSKYGWPHKKAGSKYSPDEMSFRQTINGQARSDRGFTVVVDRESKRVLISFDSNEVASHHGKWLETVAARVGLKELDPQPYWGFSDLSNKAGSKLLNCFFVQAEVKRVEEIDYYHYSRIMMLQGFNIEGLLKGIEEGYAYIDFDARTGHNHGTKFRIRANSLPLLYSSGVIID
ncbi:MAG TPA: MvaI/BcnI family restriction endonuclease [Promineifilum sp.]|nr:MvaI/BcnI family restriction endonuclease [Promineifilum sp.]